MLLQPPLVHEKYQVFYYDLVNHVLSRQVRIIQHTLCVFYHMLMLQQFIEIEEVLEIPEFLFIDLLLYNLNFSQYLVSGHDKLLLTIEFHHVFLLYLFIN